MMSEHSEGIETALQVEHAAVYVYGALGGRATLLDDDVAEPLGDDLQDAYEAHVDLRDFLVGLVGGATTVPPDPAYQLPGRLGTADRIRRTARKIEQSSTAALLAAVADADGPDRRRLVAALGDAATRELTFGGTPSEFPGT